MVVLDLMFVLVNNVRLNSFGTKWTKQEHCRKYHSYFWVFKKNVDGNSIYIKFKVLYQKDGGVRVVSFHIDEY